MSQTIIHQADCEFKQDVLIGLSQHSKSIPSKYFYDQQGSDLFNRITRHPDYYLTRCELEILENYKKELIELLGKDEFNLIELGPGEALKSRILLREFALNALPFTYYPIDISKKYLNAMIETFKVEDWKFKLQGIHADYFKGLDWISQNSSLKNLVLFLGSSIGNFDWISTQNFLHHLHRSLHDKDYVLIGFDLKKDIDVLKQAYNDRAGITREFNLNLLRRMNRELRARFKLSQFFHYPNYNVSTGAMESYLVSKQDQEVYIESLAKTFYFAAFEPIHVEHSYKYNLQQLNELAHSCGFKVVSTFMDQKNYFADVLWQV